MKLATCLTGTAIALLLPFLPQEPAAGQEEKLPTIREIMQQAHRCSNNYLGQVSRQLYRSEPDWVAVQRRAEDLAYLAQLLNRNTPRKGTRESWDLLTNTYVAHATLLADAACRQDLQTAQQQTRSLRSLCVTCHKAHAGR